LNPWYRGLSLVWDYKDSVTEAGTAASKAEVAKC